MKANTLRKYWYVCLFLVVVSVAPLARAQNANSGELKGALMDPSGAVVPGVAVSIKNVLTGVVTPTTTNESGLYDVPFLAPGNYTITFSKQGFRPFVREGIVLHVETLEVSATLQLGVSTQEIDAAPIVGTDWRAEMIQLIPGVNTGGGGGMAGPGQQSGVNGTQGYNINFLTDGSGSTDPRD